MTNQEIGHQLFLQGVYHEYGLNKGLQLSTKLAINCYKRAYEEYGHISALVFYFMNRSGYLRSDFDYKVTGALYTTCWNICESGSFVLDPIECTRDYGWRAIAIKRWSIFIRYGQVSEVPRAHFTRMTLINHFIDQNTDHDFKAVVLWQYPIVYREYNQETTMHESARLGNVEAQIDVGFGLFNARGTFADTEMLQQAAKQGHITAQFAIGYYYALGAMLYTYPHPWEPQMCAAADDIDTNDMENIQIAIKWFKQCVEF